MPRPNNTTQSKQNNAVVVLKKPFFVVLLLRRFPVAFLPTLLQKQKKARLCGRAQNQHVFKTF